MNRFRTAVAVCLCTLVWSSAATAQAPMVTATSWMRRTWRSAAPRCP